HRGGTLDFLSRCRLPELPNPTDEPWGESRFQIKRRLRIPHAFQPQHHHPRRGQRHEMAGDHDSRVTKRTSLAVGWIAIDDDDLIPSRVQIVSGAKSDDAASDYNDAIAQ